MTAQQQQRRHKIIYYACTPAYITVIHIKATRHRTHSRPRRPLLSSFRNKKACVRGDTRPYTKVREDSSDNKRSSLQGRADATDGAVGRVTYARPVTCARRRSNCSLDIPSVARMNSTITNSQSPRPGRRRERFVVFACSSEQPSVRFGKQARIITCSVPTLCTYTSSSSNRRKSAFKVAHTVSGFGK